MNKKQIMKVSYCKEYSNNNSECYGIYLGDNKLLLEDLSIIDLFKNKVSTSITEKKYGRFYMENLKVKEVNVSATRNVPVEIREGLEKAYESVDKILKMDRKLDKILEEYRNEMAIQIELIKDVPKICRESRGILTENEFLKEFEKNLSHQVTNEIKRNEYRLKTFNHNILIKRKTMIEKWASPSYSYLEYDDTRFINRDINPEAYDKDLKAYSKPLPVEGKFSEYLSLGDKNWLSYSGTYTIDVDIKKPLTKEYAKELAEKFCETKTLENEKDEENEDIELI